MISYYNPENLTVGVKAFVFHPDLERDLVLLLRRRKNNLLTFPGGQVEPSIDRSLKAAFDRELDEEARLKIDPERGLQLLALHIFRHQAKEQQPKKVARVIGIAYATSSEVVIEDDDHNEALWVPRRELGAQALEQTLSSTMPMLLDENGRFRQNPIDPNNHLWPLAPATLR